eukprot:TRINITY_DN80490_c0_g1_i1.p1 TRINITY_DN80490_c0_g1~~TRINITY_DN80490_c0_g1_i1.p1  ORF type:complete len:207 (+),score=6.41 TRINITY_DN80490_c0_g1_i1:362-982(+)
MPNDLPVSLLRRRYYSHFCTHAMTTVVQIAQGASKCPPRCRDLRARAFNPPRAADGLRSTVLMCQWLVMVAVIVSTPALVNSVRLTLALFLFVVPLPLIYYETIPPLTSFACNAKFPKYQAMLVAAWQAVPLASVVTTWSWSDQLPGHIIVLVFDGIITNVVLVVVALRIGWDHLDLVLFLLSFSFPPAAVVLALSRQDLALTQSS